MNLDGLFTEKESSSTQEVTSFALLYILRFESLFLMGTAILLVVFTSCRLALLKRINYLKSLSF